MTKVYRHGSYFKPEIKFHCWKCDCWFSTDEYRYENRTVDNKKVPVPVTRCPECEYIVDKKTTDRF